MSTSSGDGSNYPRHWFESHTGPPVTGRRNARRLSLFQTILDDRAARVKQVGQTRRRRRSSWLLHFGLKAAMVMSEKLLTPEQVAEQLQVTEHTVYGWLRGRRLPALKLGRLWRIRPQDLDAFLEAARATASS